MEQKPEAAEERVIVSQLSEKTTYCFKIQPECDVGVGLESDISEPIATEMIVPSKPGKPIASDVTYDSIELEWTKPEEGAHNVTSYIIFYRSSSDPPDQWMIWMEPKTEIAEERVVVSQLSEKTTYCFKVQPECEASVGLESDISEPITTKMIIPSKSGKPRVTYDSIELYE